MQSVKPTIYKKIKTLYCFTPVLFILFSALIQPVFSQDNSPYSRYGIGDLVSSTSMTSRGMGSIAAGYADYLSLNFNNPASYHNFQTGPQGKGNKYSSGRMIFDVGMNFEGRKLTQDNPPGEFSASNALFSYAQIGVPLRRNWGLSFGLRPVSRISYRIFHNERLTGIDSATTRYDGDGGSYLATVGTGFTVFKKDIDKMQRSLSIGFNAGYYFGKKDYSSRRSLINDSVEYFQGNFQTKTSFGNIFFNAGAQFRTPLNKELLLTVGVYGNWRQHLNASQDKVRETFVYDATFGDLRLDSVSDMRNVKGKIILPGSVTFGFVLQKVPPTVKESAWMFGIDFSTQNWNQYRFYGERDSVRNKWELRIGGQFNPVPGRNYFNNIAYRAGIFFGPDYIKVQSKLPQFGVSLGLGLPIRNESRLSPYQASIINLGFEFIKRGDTKNLLRENLFRLSVGFSLSDFWFIKRKYD